MIRVGHILKHEDIHGVSGTGKVAEVLEASNGKAIVVWISTTPSVVVFDNIKALEGAHSHGGKTQIIWDWESPQDVDPMDAVFEKKIIEARGSTAPAGVKGTTAKAGKGEEEKDAEAEALAEEIVAEAEETAERVSKKVAEKLKDQIAEKAAQIAVESLTEENGAEEQD